MENTELIQGTEIEAPPETGVPEVPEETVIETPPDEIDETPDPTKLQSEIDDLLDTKKKAEEDARYWRRQKAEARAEYFKGREKDEIKSPPAAEIGIEPQQADFEDFAEYNKALVDYRVKQARASWEHDQAEDRQKQTQVERAEALKGKLQKGFEVYDDFEDVVYDQTAAHITPMVVDLLADCDRPDLVAYHLAKDRVEGVKISRMTPIQAARAIARIETRLITENESGSLPKIETKKKVSEAPTPINALKSGESGVTGKDPDKMPQKEYEEWRESQGAKRY